MMFNNHPFDSTASILTAIYLLAWGCFLSPIQGDDWPKWLGPLGDSVWREQGILDRFPESGPNLRWKSKIAGGYSGPSVSDGKVLLMDWIADPSAAKPKNLNEGSIPKNQNFVRELRPGRERVICLDEKNGRPIWTRQYQCDYTSVATYAIGPRCAPVIDDQRVYSLGGEGHLHCLNLLDGKTIWAKNFVKDFGLKIPEWGVASHPLVDGNQLICMVGGKNTCIAFDKHNGKILWQGINAGKPGYCSPVIYEFGGKRQLIIWHSDALDALDPATGKQIWSIPFKSTYAMSIGVPRKEGNRLFLMCFAGRCAAIDVADDGQSAILAWEGNRKKGIDGVMNTPFLLDGHIYGCGNGGRYVCASLKDGKQLWTSYQPAGSKRPLTWGNVFTVRQGNRFFLANDQG
ncbi:MAG: PQQ-binding-like beta-propeller repeat protein, partial [Planctomycetota bacterium]|nr:PQQ-binding-like beta-propeller repeat protein [Planctomycetota bacterium]